MNVVLFFSGMKFLTQSGADSGGGDADEQEEWWGWFGHREQTGLERDWAKLEIGTGAGGVVTEKQKVVQGVWIYRAGKGGVVTELTGEDCGFGLEESVGVVQDAEAIVVGAGRGEVCCFCLLEEGRV